MITDLDIAIVMDQPERYLLNLCEGCLPSHGSHIHIAQKIVYILRLLSAIVWLLFNLHNEFVF